MEAFFIRSFALIIYFAIFGLVGSVIGQRTGNHVAGFILGCLLGFIGWIIVACMPKTYNFKLKEIDDRIKFEKLAKKRRLKAK